MARKKKETLDTPKETVAEITLQPITDTIEKNFMPYAMSVIVARAIPEIDGFKPSHRKLLYTMYKMGLMTGERSKSANVVGRTMQLNPHGDGAIYETLVRLTRGNETLLHPFIDSKGNFGKHYSSDMAYAASRYTEVKLDSFCQEIFGGIDHDAVDFVDNYDATMKEPSLLPTSFPNILLSPNKGIAVAMSSSICSFNLSELCDATIQLLHDPDSTVDQILDILRAPDFQGGGYLIYNREQMREIYRSGRGSLRLRARYSYDKQENCIEITEIPYSTTVELIQKRLDVLVKEGKLKELTDYRNETDRNGFKLTLDLRRGVDPDKLMTKLYKMTPLEDTFDCNFTVLIDSTPKLLGVSDILLEWIRFRSECVRRELRFDLQKKQDKLHLLLGLGKILLDIDRAIKIVRDTKLEKDVVPNLMDGFGIDEIQAEYIAEIKLRNLNREYIINRIQEIESLQKEIADLEALIGSDKRLREYIAKQLKGIKAKYGKPRQTQLIYADEIETYQEEDHVEDYNVRLVMTAEGYFKKITLLSLRGSDEHKLKEGDSIKLQIDASNLDELLFFSDKAQVYKARVADFDTCKASELGVYVPAKLDFEEGEKLLTVCCLREYNPTHNMAFFFENGKGVRVPITAYATKTNRRRLTNAYADASPIVEAYYEKEPQSYLLISNVDRAILLDGELIPLKPTRTAQGVMLMTLRRGQTLSRVLDPAGYAALENPKAYRKTKVPATGTALAEKDMEKQQVKLF